MEIFDHRRVGEVYIKISGARDSVTSLMTSSLLISV